MKRAATKEERKEAIAYYQSDESLTLLDVGKKYGRTKTCIMQWLQKAGVPVRTRRTDTSKPPVLPPDSYLEFLRYAGTNERGDCMGRFRCLYENTSNDFAKRKSSLKGICGKEFSKPVTLVTSGQVLSCLECGHLRRRKPIEELSLSYKVDYDIATREERDKLNGHKFLAQRLSSLRRLYGLTLEDYDKMFADQDGRCAICGEPVPEGRSLDVDHDHNTNQVRGLLCTRHNLALGGFDDNPRFLWNAIQYLNKYRKLHCA